MHHYPPDDFKCLYTDNCPYLNGLSTTWVMGEYCRGEDTYQEHLQIIERFQEDLTSSYKRIRDLEKENAELKAKLQALHQRQFKPNNQKKRQEGRNDSIHKPENKKRGAPIGHPGWTRPKPRHVDKTITVSPPTICPHCQSVNLIPMQGQMEHRQEDIALQTRALVTCYQHGQSFCQNCNRVVVQAGEGEILNAPIGPVAKSVAIYLRYRMGLPYRKTATLFRELFGLNFVPASALGFDRKVAARGTAIYEDLREKIRASAIVHADETSWRNDGQGHYVWFAGNENLAFFHIDRHRSSEVAKNIFGKHFTGILVRDRYAAYNGIGRDWQSCLAHILTKAKEIKQEHALLPVSKKDKALDSFCDRIIDLCKRLCILGQELKAGTMPWTQAGMLRERYVKKLKSICKQPLTFKPGETPRAFLTGPDKKFIFTFLRHQGVPPTNNHAEQSIRHLVIFRKICFGTRSEKGLKTHSIIPSLIQTARRQGVDPRNFLQTLLTSDTTTSQAALYKNSS